MAGEYLSKSRFGHKNTAGQLTASRSSGGESPRPSRYSASSHFAATAQRRRAFRDGNEFRSMRSSSSAPGPSFLSIGLSFPTSRRAPPPEPKNKKITLNIRPKTHLFPSLLRAQRPRCAPPPLLVEVQYARDRHLNSDPAIPSVSLCLRATFDRAPNHATPRIERRKTNPPRHKKPHGATGPRRSCRTKPPVTMTGVTGKVTDRYNLLQLFKSNSARTGGLGRVPDGLLVWRAGRREHATWLRAYRGGDLFVAGMRTL